MKDFRPEKAIAEKLKEMFHCVPYNARMLPSACLQRREMAQTDKVLILKWKKNPGSGALLTDKILGLEKCLACETYAKKL